MSRNIQRVESLPDLFVAERKNVKLNFTGSDGPDHNKNLDWNKRKKVTKLKLKKVSLEVFHHFKLRQSRSIEHCSLSKLQNSSQ